MSRTAAALIVRGAATFLKSRRLQSIEALTHCAECRKSPPPDTDSRLLTEKETRPNLLTAVIFEGSSREPRGKPVHSGQASCFMIHGGRRVTRMMAGRPRTAVSPTLGAVPSKYRLALRTCEYR